MLDIILFRTDQGGNPDLVRESQRRRYADVTLVDKVIEHDSEWRRTRGALDDAKKGKNAVQKKIGEFMKKKEAPPDELKAEKKAAEDAISTLEAKEKELLAARDKTLGLIGARAAPSSAEPEPACPRGRVRARARARAVLCCGAALASRGEALPTLCFLCLRARGARVRPSPRMRTTAKSGAY